MFEILKDRNSCAHKTEHGVVSYQPVTNMNVANRLIDLFQKEVELYRPIWQKSIQVHSVYLVTRLYFNGEKWSAVPILDIDGDGNRLFIDCELVDLTRNGEIYYRRLLHHEMFHIMEYCALSADQEDYIDGAWSTLTPAYLCNNQRVCHPCNDDFVSHYSRVSPKEDRAEVYSLLIVLPDLPMKPLSDVICTKVDYVLEFLGQFVCQEWGCPEFWTRRHSQSKL